MFEDMEHTQCGGFYLTIPSSLEKFFYFLVLLGFFTDLVLKLGQPTLHAIACSPSFV
jgi:hypothetical protein